jgi:hypothetical protein
MSPAVSCRGGLRPPVSRNRPGRRDDAACGGGTGGRSPRLRIGLRARHLAPPRAHEGGRGGKRGLCCDPFRSIEQRSCDNRLDADCAVATIGGGPMAPGSATIGWTPMIAEGRADTRKPRYLPKGRDRPPKRQLLVIRGDRWGRGLMTPPKQIARRRGTPVRPVAGHARGLPGVGLPGSGAKCRPDGRSRRGCAVGGQRPRAPRHALPPYGSCLSGRGRRCRLGPSSWASRMRPADSAGHGGSPIGCCGRAHRTDGRAALCANSR